MRYFELAEPEHPAKREKPHHIASLAVYQGEEADLKAIRDAHGPTQIVGTKKVPIIPVVQVEVLCKDPETAWALREAWWTFEETSPHRPHSREEADAWGAQYSPYRDIPPDWTF